MNLKIDLCCYPKMGKVRPVWFVRVGGYGTRRKASEVGKLLTKSLEFYEASGGEKMTICPRCGAVIPAAEIAWLPTSEEVQVPMIAPDCCRLCRAAQQAEKDAGCYVEQWIPCVK